MIIIICQGVLVYWCGGCACSTVEEVCDNSAVIVTVYMNVMVCRKSMQTCHSLCCRGSLPRTRKVVFCVWVVGCMRRYRHVISEAGASILGFIIKLPQLGPAFWLLLQELLNMSHLFWILLHSAGMLMKYKSISIILDLLLETSGKFCKLLTVLRHSPYGAATWWQFYELLKVF